MRAFQIAKTLVTTILCCAFADEALASDEDVILAALKKVNPTVEYSQPVPSGIPGLYQVSAGNAYIFVSADGKRFIVGDMFQDTGKGFANLTAAARQQARVDALKAIPRKDMIIFSPEGAVKGAIYVFTDADCAFCQKLHGEIDEINELGIEVRYLAFPRAGIGSEGYKKLVWAHCAEDPKDAYTRLTKDKSIDERECPNSVEQQYRMAKSFGVNGTPTMVKENGELREGYLSPDQLAKSLGIQ